MDSTSRTEAGSKAAQPILVAVEAVPESSAVIATARRMAQRSASEVLVLSVRERDYTRGIVWDRRPMGEIAEFLNSAVFELGRAGILARGLIRTTRSGHAAEEIVAAAHQHHAGTILVGSSRRSWLGSFFFGSVSHRVVRASEVPVVLVPTRSRRSARQPAAVRSGSAAAPKR